MASGSVGSWTSPLRLDSRQKTIHGRSSKPEATLVTSHYSSSRMDASGGVPHVSVRVRHGLKSGQSGRAQPQHGQSQRGASASRRNIARNVPPDILEFNRSQRNNMAANSPRVMGGGWSVDSNRAGDAAAAWRASIGGGSVLMDTSAEVSLELEPKRADNGEPVAPRSFTQQLNTRPYTKDQRTAQLRRMMVKRNPRALAEPESHHVHSFFETQAFSGFTCGAAARAQLVAPHRDRVRARPSSTNPATHTPTAQVTLADIRGAVAIAMDKEVSERSEGDGGSRVLPATAQLQKQTSVDNTYSPMGSLTETHMGATLFADGSLDASGAGMGVVVKRTTLSPKKRQWSAENNPQRMGGQAAAGSAGTAAAALRRQKQDTRTLTLARIYEEHVRAREAKKSLGAAWPIGPQVSI